MRIATVWFALLLSFFTLTASGAEPSIFDGSWQCSVRGTGAMSSVRHSLKLNIQDGQVKTLLAENLWIRGKDGDRTHFCVFRMDDAPITRQSASHAAITLEARNFDDDETFCEVRISRAKKALTVKFEKSCLRFCPDSFKVMHDWSLNISSNKCIP